MNERRICVILGSRANYSSIKAAVLALKAYRGIELTIVATASAVVEKYGSLESVISEDGLNVDRRVFSLLEGNTPETMAMSTGLGLVELPSVLRDLRPDVVITVGDRFETMATALAASYMNICLAHTMGGEITGSIDESIRHAVTKLAHIHFPATERAAQRIVQLGEDSANVYVVGCPRIDLARDVIESDDQVGAQIFETGVGEGFDLDGPFAIIMQHPVTTELGNGKEQMELILHAVQRSGLPSIVMWPNADAGSDEISRGVRIWREQGLGLRTHFFKNLPPDRYMALMNMAAVVVGNSSSAIREGAFLGVPAVNIGSRQSGRERAANVVDVPMKADDILAAVQMQLERGKYPRSLLYGDGEAGPRIAKILAENPLPTIQKTLSF